MKTQDESKAADKLIEVLNEREAGYNKVAENVEDPSMASVFRDYARQSRQMAQQLIPYSNEYSPEEEGTRAVADSWRVWIDLKSALTGGSSKAMLGASETGEDSAIRNFEDVIEDTKLDPEFRQRVESVLAEMRVARDDIHKRRELSS